MNVRSALCLLFLMSNLTAYNSCEENTNNCYESSGEPLHCGAFDVQIQGGIDPIIWRNREAISNVNCEIPAPLGPVIKNLDFPKFNQLYHLPWIAGGQIGYSLSENTRIFIEGNYIQARAKKNPTFNIENAAAGQTVALLGEKYSLFDFYGGARYYFDRCCNYASVFLGGKIGLTHHKSVDFNYLASSPAGVIEFPEPVPFFLSNTVVSGGGHIGIDFCFCSNVSFVLTFEVVASCGPKSNANIELTPDFAPSTNIFLGLIYSEVRFPITAAIRYSF